MPAVRGLSVLVASLCCMPVLAQRNESDLFAASTSARANGRFAMLLRQFRADEPTLPEHFEAGARPATARYQGATDLPAGYWVWQRPYWFLFRDGPGDAAPQRSWGPEAACGPPDTAQPGDQGTAWASKEPDRPGEWLLLEYDAPVKAASLEVHETFNPGALAAVAIFTPQGEELEVWRARRIEPAAEKGRVLQLDLPLGFQVERVRLSFASERVDGWNEIDAVGLKDDKGLMHWARRAEASSTYAELAAKAGAPAGAVVIAPLVGGQVLNLQLPLQLQPVQLQPLQVQLPRVHVAAPPPRIQLQPVPGAAGGDDAEKKRLQQRIDELEARVKELEAELARARARNAR